jgi:hypothetical protein
MRTLSLTTQVPVTETKPVVRPQAYARVYYECFIIALLITLGPSKAFANVAPLVILFWFIVRTASGQTLRRLTLLLLSFSLLTAFYFILYRMQGVDFLVGNAVVSFITYSSFALVLCLPGKGIIEPGMYDKYAKVLKYALLIEAIVGIMQFLVVTLTKRFTILPGDAVQGTISLFPFVVKDAGFGNQMFVINMAFLLLFFIPYALVNRKDYWVVLLALVSVMLAGVMHVFISLIWSFLFTIFFFRKNILFGDFFKILFALVLVVSLLIPFEFLFPGIFRSASIFISLYEDKNSPKFEAIEKATEALPEKYPSAYLVGIGPGQYSSRAGLISSGKYFSVKTPLLPNTTSPFFKNYFETTWKKYSTNTNRYGNSTMHRPFFSLLSIFAEFGLVGITLFIGIILYIFFNIRGLFLKFKTNKQNKEIYLSFSLGVLIVNFFFISLFENYLETTQAILTGLLLSKIIYSYLLHQKNSNSELAEKPPVAIHTGSS